MNLKVVSVFNPIKRFQPFLFFVAPPELETPLDILYFSISGFYSSVGRGEQNRDDWAGMGVMETCDLVLYSLLSHCSFHYTILVCTYRWRDTKLGAVHKGMQIQLCLPESDNLSSKLPFTCSPSLQYVLLLAQILPRELMSNTISTLGIPVVPVYLLMEDSSSH